MCYRVLPSDLSAQEHKTTKYNQMLYINLLSATVSMVTLLVNASAQGDSVLAGVVVIALAAMRLVVFMMAHRVQDATRRFIAGIRTYRTSTRGHSWIRTDQHSSHPEHSFMTVLPDG